MNEGDELRTWSFEQIGKTQQVKESCKGICLIYEDSCL